MLHSCEAPPRLVATALIRHAEVDGARIILDLGSESYRILDPVGGVMWAILVGDADTGLALEAVSREYGVPIGRLRSDLASFTQRCVREHLLEAPDSIERNAGRGFLENCSGATSRRWLRMVALADLIATSRSLARRGFKTTYERWGRLACHRSSLDLTDAVSAFLWAENFYWSRRSPDDCLARSLALYRFLCKAGLNAEHVMGVKRIPFRAHAWVEYEGGALLKKGVNKIFVPIARLRARPCICEDPT